MIWGKLDIFLLLSRHSLLLIVVHLGNQLPRSEHRIRGLPVRRKCHLQSANVPVLRGDGLFKIGCSFGDRQEYEFISVFPGRSSRHRRFILDAAQCHETGTECSYSKGAVDADRCNFSLCTIRTMAPPVASSLLTLLQIRRGFL